MKQTRISAIAHHSRNRLTGLIARLEQSGHTEFTQELRSLAEQWALVQALLRLEGDEPIHYFEVDLESFCGELFAEAQLLTPKGLVLCTGLSTSRGMFPIWTFDAPLVRIVILDALANAWRFASKAVVLSCEISEGLLVFSIKDDGPGFSEALLVSKKPTLPFSTGTGQGLGLARRVAEGHVINGRQGEVVLSNDGGALFRLCLP